MLKFQWMNLFKHCNCLKRKKRLLGLRRLGVRVPHGAPIEPCDCNSHRVLFFIGRHLGYILKRQRRQPLYGSMAKKTLKGDEIAEILNRETAKWVQTLQFLCFCKEFIFLVLNYDITKHRRRCYLPLLLSGLFLWIQNLRNSR